MQSEKAKKISLIILAFSIMFIIGFLGNLRGVLLPTMKQNLGINYSSIGIMILISGIGYMCSTFFSGFLCDKLGHKRVFAIGFSLVFLGLIGVAFTRSFTMLLFTITVLSIGLGSFDIGLNSLTPKIFVTNTAVMMSFMHVFFGLGSAVSPKFGGWMLSHNVSWYNVYFYSIGFVGAAFLIFIFSPSLPSPKTVHAETIPFKSLLSDKRIWLFIGVLGFCESTELGISNWLVNFLQVERGMNESLSSQYMFYFFIIYTIGRIFGGYIAEKVGYVRVIISFVSSAVILFTGGLLLGNTFAFLFAVTGFFISIMFPTMVTLISKEFPQNSSSVLGLIITMSGMTCYIVNWIIGKLNDTLGVFAGFASVIVYGSMIVILLSILNRSLTFCSKKIIEPTPCSAE